MVILASFLMTACLKPYEPEIPQEIEGYLVVESGIDLSNGKGEIILSRTKALDAVNQKTFETDAEVWLEGEDGNQFSLLEEYKGFYVADFQALSTDQEYRLHIITADKEEFQSDYIPIKIAPEIDSLTWKADEDGLVFFVDTHDDTNETKYYQWEFIETSEYNSFFFTNGFYEEDNHLVVERDQETQNIYICWAENLSQSIILANTANLTNDIISNKKVHTLPPDSWKHRFKYSILVKQYALTVAEYDYWYRLQQSNENQGSIFDAQPSNIGSNIKSLTRPDSPVFGYFSLNASSQKRVFIRQTDLPSWERGFNIPHDCKPNDAVFVSIQDFYADPFAYNIAEIIYNLFGIIIGINDAPIECIDCSYADRGSTIRPDYWE